MHALSLNCYKTPIKIEDKIYNVPVFTISGADIDRIPGEEDTDRVVLVPPGGLGYTDNIGEPDQFRFCFLAKDDDKNGCFFSFPAQGTSGEIDQLSEFFEDSKKYPFFIYISSATHRAEFCVNPTGEVWTCDSGRIQ